MTSTAIIVSGMLIAACVGPDVFITMGEFMRCFMAVILGLCISMDIIVFLVNTTRK